MGNGGHALLCPPYKRPRRILSVLPVIHLVYNALRVGAGHARRILLFNRFKELASCPSVGRPRAGGASLLSRCLPIRMPARLPGPKRSLRRFRRSFLPARRAT